MSYENRKKVYEAEIAKGKTPSERLVKEFGAIPTPIKKEPVTIKLKKKQGKK